MTANNTAKFTKEQLIERTFRRAAIVLHEVWEEGWGHTRFLDNPLIPDRLVEVGRSRQGGERREHVVPLIAIYTRCEDMFKAGASVEAVADLLSRHVKIVRISRVEQQRIDRDLGLKSRMPDGWSFDDEGADVFARLRLGGVIWD